MKSNAYPQWNTGGFDVRRSEKPVVRWIEQGDSRLMANVDNLLQSDGRHERRAREWETLLIKQLGAASSLKGGTQVSSARVEGANVASPLLGKKAPGSNS